MLPMLTQGFKRGNEPGTRMGVAREESK
jgi:hypothetical protein